MLYTRKGDDGKTKTFACDQRISKSSAIAEALGSLDEINSFLGFCKVRSTTQKCEVGSVSCASIIHQLQKDLFIIQAEVAGAEKTIGEDKVKEIESIVDAIEKELPPIKTFFVSGGTELAATFDFARTVARMAERRVVSVAEEGKVKVGEFSLAYLNRISSLLYALARYANHKAGIKEEAPDYK
jgi:cob(I)alamin adenosyltransferase